MFYWRMPFLRPRKWWGSSQDSGYSRLCTTHSLLPFSHGEHLEDHREDLEGGRPPGRTVCGDRLHVGRQSWEVSPQKVAGGVLICPSVLTAQGLLSKHTSMRLAQWALGSLQEVSALSTQPPLPPAADIPDWRGAEWGQHSGWPRKEVGAGAFPKLPSLQNTSLLFSLTSSSKYSLEWTFLY